MRYCINPHCQKRENQGDPRCCQTCDTGLEIKGRYEILSIIHSNSKTGWEVFRVQDIESSQKYVLKTLAVKGSESDMKVFKKLFSEEQESLKNLQHSGIPKYKEDFSIPAKGSRPELDCLVMESIDGRDLEKWLREHQKLRSREMAIEWLREITTILAYTHSKRRFHRDIKPSNIMLREKGSLVLIDFGIARQIDTRVINEGAQTFVRTPNYAAPEQLLGKAYPESDFFALGKTFIHLLTGKLPEVGVIALEDWQYETVFSKTGIVALIDWLVQEPRNLRPQTTGQILKVINYINERKSDGSYPDDADTQRFINNIKLETSTIESDDSANRKDSVEKTEQDINIPEITGENQSSNDKNDEGETTNSIKQWLPIVALTVIVASTVASAVTCTLTQCIKKPDTHSTPSVSTPIPKSSVELKDENLISFGDRLLSNRKDSKYNEKDSKLRDAAIQDFKDENYEEAYQKIYKLRSKIKQDPQLLIFMNNAKVRYFAKKDKQPIHTIAASFPVGEERGEQALYGVAHLQHDVVNPKDDLLFKPDDSSRDNLLKSTPVILLEVAIVNDKNDPTNFIKNSNSQDLNLAEKLTQGSIKSSNGKERNILALVGHYTSEVTNAALPTYCRDGLPIVSPLSTATTLSGKCQENNNVFFRTSSSSAIEAQTLTKQIKERQKNQSNLKVVAFYKNSDSEVYDIYSKDIFKQINEVELKEDPIPKDNIFNFNSDDEINNSKNKIKDADMVLLLPNGKNAGNPKNDKGFEKTIDILKYTEAKINTVFLGSNPLVTASLGEISMKKLHKKLLLAVDWSEDSKIANEAFTKRYRSLWGGGLNRTTALSYEAAQVLSHLIKDGKTTRQDIINGLKQLKTGDVKSYVFNDGRGISFENGDRVEIKERILVTPSQDGTKFVEYK